MKQSKILSMIREEPAFTAFQRKVYRAILAIPAGEVRSYAWVARTIGNPAACRAVGQALKRNPYPVIIPCHRVIRSDGTIGGYSRGISRKKKLLNYETKH